MTLRIAMVGACPYPVPQGSQVLMRETARSLADAGHEVHLVVYGHGIGEDTSGLHVHRGARLPGVRRTAAGPSFTKPVLDAELVRRLRRVAHDHRIQIVHAHNYEGLMVALAARVAPVVYHAHNAMTDELPYYMRPRAAAKKFGSWLDRTFPKRADHIIAPHQTLADYLISEGCDASRVSVLAPSVDLRPFEPPPRNGVAPAVIYTGNLDGYQNLGLLRDAMAVVKRSSPDVRLIVATAECATRTIQGVLVPTPDLPSLISALRLGNVFVCPRTSWSGYPMKLLNAMAAGKAIVACAGAAHPLRHDVTGLVVDNDDVSGFAAAIGQLIRDSALRTRLGQAARDTAARDHAPDSTARAIEDVYAKVLNAEHV